MKHGDDIPSSLLNQHGHHVKLNAEGYDNVEMVPRHEVERYASQPTTAEHAKEVGTHVATSGQMEPLILHYHPKTSEAYLGEGNHRLRAAKTLGMDHVPVRVSRNVYGLSGPGVKTPSAHPAIAAGGHVPADIKPSEIGLGTMNKTAGGPLPSGLTYEYRKEPSELGDQHTLIARHPDASSEGWGPRGKLKDWKGRAGHISWYHDGEVGGVEVHPDHQRKGIATELYRRAKEISPHIHHSEDLTSDGAAWSKTVAMKRNAYGETRAPADVDTLRDPNCPVCGDDTFDGAECSVCGFIQPPAFLRDPDLAKAQQIDLRKQVTEMDPNADQQEPLQPNDVADPSQVNDDGTVSGQGIDPGSLPGEVEGEVQTAQTGVDGQPLTMDDSQGLDVPVGPDGMPVGPQELPAQAQDPMGKPFTQGPNMPDGPGGPEDPGLADTSQESPSSMQGLEPGFDGQTGTPQTSAEPAETALTCSNCGFQAESSPPSSIDLQNPDASGSDGTVAGDVCPYCQQGQLMSGSELTGQDPPSMPTV